jgi:hypothetical protein
MGAVPSFPTRPYRKRGSSEMGDPTGLLTSMQMAMNAAISGSTFTNPEVCFVTEWQALATASCVHLIAYWGLAYYDPLQQRGEVPLPVSCENWQRSLLQSVLDKTIGWRA